jgi:hypothetical protein
VGRLLNEALDALHASTGKSRKTSTTPETNS